MTTYYKLTDKDGRTGIGYTEVTWRPGVAHTATGNGTDLCTDGYVHAYVDPLLAVLLNPISGNFVKPQMFTFETNEAPLHKGQLKCGFKTVPFGAWVAVPEITLTQKVVFAILCAKAVYKNAKWNKWADAWLSGKDRSAASAGAAETAAERAAETAWAAWAAVEAAQIAKLELNLITLAQLAMTYKEATVG